MPPRQRVLHRATVSATERLSPNLTRVTFDCPELVGLELPFTDHYIKILFSPADAAVPGPVDPEVAEAAGPGSAVTRTYSLRSHDVATGAIAVDFVVHGDEGLAGPWAARAAVGDRIGFFGPGGAWAPRPDFGHFMLVGDESAAPAICAAIESLPASATATVYLEVAESSATFPVPVRDGVDLRWVARDGAPYGAALVEAVLAAQLPTGRVGWFVHGVAEMVKELRRYLFVDLGLHRADVSISGYWRAGMNEDGWQGSKHAFVESMDRAEVEAGAEPVPSKEPRGA